jgi:heme-degrading monooxygenase HmoA
MGNTGGVIARIWRGWARTDQADLYQAHYEDEVLPTLRRVPGFCDARLLRRATGPETEFVSLVLFDDLDAVRAFAGDDHETAVVADEAQRVLVRFDEKVVHYDVAVS